MDEHCDSHRSCSRRRGGGRNCHGRPGRQQDPQRQSRAPAVASATDTTSRIVAAAQALVATLDDAGRAKVQFPFEGPQKTRWSNLPSPLFRAARAAAGRPDGAAARRRHGTGGHGAEPRRATRKSKPSCRATKCCGPRPPTGAVAEDGQAAGRAGGGPSFRQGRVLRRLRRHSLHDTTVDAAVRRAPPGDQPHDRREPGEHDAQPAGGAAGHVHHRRPHGPPAGGTKTTRRSRSSTRWTPRSAARRS